LLDPRIVKKISGNKRVAARDPQSERDLEPPAKKKRAVQSVAGSKSKPPSDDSFLGRSSQSVNDLPRMEDLNAGLAGGQMQSSHMRTSAGSRRTTRNQKTSKGVYHDPTYTLVETNISAGDTFQTRFSQELHRHDHHPRC
jgi:hypothetical protein